MSGEYATGRGTPEPEVVDGVGRYGRVRPNAAGGEIPLVLDGRELGRLPVAGLLRP
jgi:hypothetical protein